MKLNGFITELKRTRIIELHQVQISSVTEAASENQHKQTELTAAKVATSKYDSKSCEQTTEH